MRTSTPAFRSPRAARLSPLAAGIALALSPASFGVTYTVTSAADSGAGTLRQAILDANANCMTDSAPTIDFSGPFVVSPSFSLPQFFCPGGTYNPTIDGGGAVNPASAGGFDANAVLNGPAGSSCGLNFPANFTYGGK